MKILQEFKEFAVKGNVVDMAVGIIIGAAFGALAKTLVDEVVMPPIKWVLSHFDMTNLFTVVIPGEPAGPYETLKAAQDAGAVTMNFGIFLNAVIAFLITAFIVFLLVKAVNNLRKKEQDKPISPTEKNCPFCQTSIPIKATRCKACTSEVTPAEVAAA